jgi:phosphoribosyl 1,2-cyclic phosphate phosphodiesterase
VKITFLGTGTSQGVPLIGCNCRVCQSTDPYDRRLRSSLWIQTDTTSVIIDTGPDFRYQALRSKIDKVDAVLFTHGHKDHVAGLDDIRAYNYWQKGPIDIYANEGTLEILYREFQYVFSGHAYPGIPQLNTHQIDETPFQIGDLHITPIKVMHYKMEVFGYRINDFTYITDANFIDTLEIDKIVGSKIVVLNALRKEKHISHFTLEEAIATAELIQAPQTYLTHISHQLGIHKEVTWELQEGIALAYDGLIIDM